MFNLLILINLVANSYTWGLVAITSGSAALNSLCQYIQTLFLLHSVLILFIHNPRKIIYMFVLC